MQFPNAIGQYRKPSGGVAIPPVVIVPAPVFTTQPGVSPTSGTTATTFTGSNGVASNTTTYSRRWLLNGTLIGTGTTVSPSTTGSLTLEVTATGPGGVSIATTNPITVTSAAIPAPVFTTQPSISPSGGDTNTTFTANTGVASNASSYTIRWLLNGTQVAGNVTTYTSAAGTLTIEVTATNSSGNAVATSSSVTVTTAAPVVSSLGVIDMTPQADPTVYPPTPSYTFYAQENGYKVGDTVRVLASPNFDRSSPTINDASYVLTGNLTNDTNGINAKIAGITSGTGYVFVRPERSSESKVGDWSTPIQYGTTAIPAMTSSSSFTVRSATKLLASLTYAAPVRRLMLYGNDMGQFELASNAAGNAYTLRWLNDGTRNYAITSQQNTQVDFNQDHIYDLSIEVTGLNGKTRRDPVSVEVQEYDTTPDAFTFAPTTGANLNAVYVREMTAALSGMASDYDAPVSITGPFDSFRIYNGTSYGPALTSTSGVTMRVGYKIELTAHSSAAYLTERDIAVTIGGTTGTWALTTKADPSAVSPTAQPFVSANPGSGNSSSAIPLTLKAGVNVVTVVGPCGTSASTTGPGTTTSTLLVNISGRFSMWEVVASADGNYSWTMTGDGNLAVYGTTTQATALANAQPGAINVVSLPYASYESPVSIGSGTTVAAGNLAIVGAFNYADSPPSLINATALASTSLGARATVGYMTASATPKYTNNYDNGDQFANGGGIVAVWRKM